MAASKKAQKAALRTIRSAARRVQLGKREDGRGSTDEALITLRLVTATEDDDEDDETTTKPES